MASPFSIFRRHQAVLLAVFGVFLMVAFVVLPAVIQMQQIGGGGGYSSDAVLAWTGGEVTKSDLDNRQQQRYQAAQFVINLRNAAQSRPGGKDMNLERELGVLLRLRDESAMSAFETMLLAQKGRDMGMSIDEKAVTSFLHRATDNTFVSDEELRAEMAAAVGKSTTLPAVYHVLKEELLAYNVMQLALKGIAPTNQRELRATNYTTTTPSEAWEYYNRMRRMVIAEFAPIAVKDYVDEVEEPSSKQVREFYNKHKDDYGIPGNPKPGFRIPQQADFHYIVADYAVYLEEEKPKVTQEELEAYYEENKEMFRIREDSFPIDEIDWDNPRQALPRPPVVEEQDDNEATAPEGEETVEPNESESDPTDLPGTNLPGTEPPGEGCDEEQSPATEEEKPVPSDEPAPVEPASDDNATADAPEDSAGTTTGDDLVVPEPAPKYKPLADVENQIRRPLAAPRAQNRMSSAIDRVREAVKKHFERVVLNEDADELDGEALADEAGLKFVKTGLIDMYSLYDQREKFEVAISSDGTRGLAFHQLAYRDGLLNYQPIETQTYESFGGGKKFLAWKVADQEPTVPKLKDIEKKVVEVWKLQAARELARQAAEELAAELDGDQPLTEQLDDDYEVITPSPFSYFLFGTLQPGAIGSGIEEQRPDVIRREVVQMPVGDVRAIPNAAKDKYYVVRLANEFGGGDQARQSFMQDLVDSPARMRPDQRDTLSEIKLIGRYDRMQLYAQWIEKLEEEYEVKQLDPEFFQQRGG